MIQKLAPGLKQQEISRIILFALETYNRQHKKGSLFYAPIDVYLDDYNKPQPDKVFVSAAKNQIITNDGIVGVPDLIVEIISPSSIIRDRIEKKNLYERMGVNEFWLVDPHYEEIEIYVLQNDRYELLSEATTSEGELKSRIFEALKINLTNIFSNAA